jgi:hypothetical protein
MKRLPFFSGFLVLLVLAFAMGQQLALLHGLGHAVEKVTHKSDSKAPSQAACVDCGLAAQLTGLPGTPPATAPLQVAGIVVALFLAVGIAARPPIVVRSRGPPSLL